MSGNELAPATETHLIQNGIAINYGCDVISRVIPAEYIEESVRDNTVIRVKELN